MLSNGTSKSQRRLSVIREKRSLHTEFLRELVDPHRGFLNNRLNNSHAPLTLEELAEVEDVHLLSRDKTKSEIAKKILGVKDELKKKLER